MSFSSGITWLKTMCTPASTCLRRFCRCRRTSSAPGSGAYACMHSQTSSVGGYVNTSNTKCCDVRHTARACCCSWCQCKSNWTKTHGRKQSWTKGGFRSLLGMYWLCQNMTSGDVHSHVCTRMCSIHISTCTKHIDIQTYSYRYTHAHAHTHTYMYICCLHTQAYRRQWGVWKASKDPC